MSGLEARWMREPWTEIIRLVSDGLTYRCPDRGGECGGYTDHGNEAHNIVRAALSGSTAPLDRERMAQTGVNVWGWDISRARQYAETFAAEYDRLSAAASPDPAQGGGRET